MGKLININYNGSPLYNINIEHGFERLLAVFGSLGSKNRRLCIVTDSTVGAIYLKTVTNIAKNCAQNVISFTFEEIGRAHV